MPEIMSFVSGEAIQNVSVPVSSTVTPLQYFQQGDKRLDHPQRARIVIPSQELVPVEGAEPYENVDHSPIPGHREYGNRSIVENTSNDAIILISEGIEEIKKRIAYWQTLHLLNIPDPKYLIPVSLGHEKQFAQAIIKQAEDVRAKIQDLYSSKQEGVPDELLVSMHSQPVDEIRESLGLMTVRSDHVPTILVDNNAITHELLREKFGQSAESLGSVPEGQIVYNISHALAVGYGLLEQYEKIVLRMPYGSSGLGIVIINNKHELELELQNPAVRHWLETDQDQKYRVGDLIAKIQTGEKISPQELAKYVKNPSGLKIESFVKPSIGGSAISAGVNLNVGTHESEDALLGISKQKLTSAKEGEPETQHTGNVYYPALWHPKMEQFLKLCADYLREMGAFGPNGIDVLILRDQDGQIEKMVLMEINSRNTAPSYMYRLTQKIIGTPFPDKSYTGINVHTTKKFQDLIESIRASGLEYKSEAQWGVIVTNIMEKYQKAMLYIIANSLNEVDEIEQKIRKSAL